MEHRFTPEHAPWAEVRDGDSVILGAGSYALEAPITLNGRRHVRVEGGGEARFAGGARVSLDWRAEGGGLYRADCEGGAFVDALVVGGRAYRQARYPHDGGQGIYGGTASDCLDFAARCAHPEDGFLHAMHTHLWGDMHYRIAGRAADGSLALEGGWQNNRPMGMHEKYRFVENLREALGAPGEFFYDPRERALYLCAEEAPSAETWLVRNPYLFRLIGCEDVRLSGITFSDSARTFMAECEPLLLSDWRIHRGGAVFAEDCARVTLEDCDFTRIGGNAVFFSGRSEGARVSRCHFWEIGASCACFVGKPSCVRSPRFSVDAGDLAPEDRLGAGPASEDYPRDCAVEDCLMHDFGRAEKQVAGVQISMASRVAVRASSIYACPRAAVNIGEGAFGGHLIEHCDLFDTVLETGDHGSFNSWGRDRFWHSGLDCEAMRALALRDAVQTTLIRQNRVRCDHGWDIDLDDGSSNYRIEGNLCLGGGIKLREGFERAVRGNTVVNGTIHPHVWFPSSGDVIEHNLMTEPYRPIGMPSGAWGERVDENLLHEAGLTRAEHAEALSGLSGRDEHSLRLDARLEGEDFLAGNPECAAAGFRREKADYGVRCARLRGLARSCPIPTLEKSYRGGGAAKRVGGVLVKNVEDDGEMSAYATAGHDGVIVLDLPFEHPWFAAGLRANRALVRANGEPLKNVEQFERLVQAGGSLEVLAKGQHGETERIWLPIGGKRS